MLMSLSLQLRTFMHVQHEAQWLTRCGLYSRALAVIKMPACSQWLARGSRRDRVAAKFVENEFEKVDRLMELYGRYGARVVAEERRLGTSDESYDDEEVLLARMDAGLYTLQQVGASWRRPVPSPNCSESPLHTRSSAHFCNVAYGSCHSALILRLPCAGVSQYCRSDATTRAAGPDGNFPAPAFVGLLWSHTWLQPSASPAGT